MAASRTQEGPQRQERALRGRSPSSPGRRQCTQDKRELKHTYLDPGGTDVSLQYDYTKGQLPELIDVIIEEKAALFVSAVGVPPKEVVERLHKAGIPVMNVSI